MAPVARLLAAQLLLIAACGGGDGTVDAGRGAPVPDPGTSPLLVSIEVGGGFVPVGHDFRQVPRAVVYADGTSFSPAAVPAIHPGPAVLPVIEGVLDQRQLDEIIDAAGDADLLGGERLDVGDPPIADAATTTITVVVDGESHVTNVYALGATSGPGEGPVGITGGQQAARDRIQAFVDHVAALATDAESDRYEPARYRVLPLEPQPVDDAIEPEQLRWPLDHIDLELRSCVAVGGADADALRTALRGASEITRWRTASDQVFSLAARTVLPHEPGCPTSS